MVPIGGEVLKELKLWKLRCLHSEMGLVFPASDTSPRDNGNFHHRTWTPLLTKAGVPHGSFHALRHSFASALINGNQSPKLVQTLLSHHSAAFTMDQYADLWPQAVEEIGDAVTATLFSGDGGKVVAATPLKGPQLLPERAEVIDLNGAILKSLCRGRWRLLPFDLFFHASVH